MNMLSTLKIIIEERENGRQRVGGELQEGKAEKVRKGRMLLSTEANIGGVIYGYKYWRSLEAGKRIVEFAGNGSCEETSDFCFPFATSTLHSHPLAILLVAFRVVSDRKSPPYFIRRAN